MSKNKEEADNVKSAKVPKEAKVGKASKSENKEAIKTSAASQKVVKSDKYQPRLLEHYLSVIRAQLKEELGYTNEMQIPRIEKIVLNMGVGEAVQDTKKVRSAAADLALITGQKPVITKAKKAISGFKVREDMPIGAKVCLRKAYMYEFLDRFLTIALPRVRDFQGLNPNSFDGNGNYAMGVKEHLIFPEIDYDKVESVYGFDIIICTSARTDDEARALLKAFNFPFRS